jgi:NAD(P)H dehydrogenase (quinone)
MIAITGATGQLGRLVIDALLQKVPANQIVAAVRHPEKAADLAAKGIVVRHADYDQPASLSAAFQGVEKLLLISSSEVGKRAAQHQAVIQAAEQAHIQLLAYTSLLHADRSVLGLGAEHRATEAALAQSTVPHVILRNGWYTENYAASIAPALIHQAFLGAANDGRIASAPRADYAAAAAAVLLADHQAGKVYELASDDHYSLAEFAAEIGKQAGKTINYVNMSEAEFGKALIGAGLPEGLALMLADSDAGAAQGAMFDDSHTLSKLIGRPTTSYRDVIAATLKA